METIEIKSLQNDLIKFIVKLQNPKFRKSEKLILIDGIKTIEGLIENDFKFEYFFTEKENLNFKNLKTEKLIKTTKDVLKKISTTDSYSQYVGVIKETKTNETIFENLSKIALIDGIKDAGNLGTIIRSACAFGIEGIILYGDCVDLYNPKVIRSSTQNMFKLPIIATKDINFIKNLKNTHKFISTVVNSKKDFSSYSFEKNFIIAFGSEANGLSQEILELSDEKLTINMQNNVESLNLAICASICFAFIHANKNQP